MKTFSAKPESVKRDWFVVDAAEIDGTGDVYAPVLYRKKKRWP